ncbi:hypothetical protein SK128_026549 [Halocaridina rubra]|uniref:PH domain-containing protein n=1 Tax=Halocaridina rubra TaxID=373956 RepID=A0AAN8ZUC4_HALRR
MDPLAAEELSEVLKKLVNVTGCVEKLVRGKWKNRYITISVPSASIHYYLSENDQKAKKVRGIYPLMGARVDEEQESNKKHYPFTVLLASGQRIRFRTSQKGKTHAWCMIISLLATKSSGIQNNPVDGILNVKSGIGWAKRLASLDVNTKFFTLGKTIRQSEGNKPVESFSLKGASVHLVKSYGKTFDFELSVTTDTGKPVKLQMRAATEEDRDMWCQAVECAIDCQKPLDLSPSRGKEAGFIIAFQTTESKPGGDEIKVVVLEGLREFSQRVSMKINHYLHPHHIIHEGKISKVYHCQLDTVAMALNAAGFNFHQLTSKGRIFELPANTNISLITTPVMSIETIIEIVWPRQSTEKSPSNSPPSPYDSTLLPSSLISRNTSSLRPDQNQSENYHGTLVRISSQSFN